MDINPRSAQARRRASAQLQRVYERAYLVWLAWAVVLLSGAMLWLSMHYLRADTLDQSRQFTQSLARVLEEQTSRTLQSIDLQMRLTAVALSQLEQKRALQTDEAQDFLKSQIKDMPYVRALWVLDLNGRIAFDSDFGNIGLDLHDRPYFVATQSAPAGNIYFGEPVQSRTTGTWMINVARGIYDAHGRLTGVLTGALEPPYFNALWSRINRGPNGSIALYRNDGTLMLRSPQNEGSPSKVQSDLLRAQPAWLRETSGSFDAISVVDGVDRLFAFQRLSYRPDLTLVVGQARETVLARWLQMQWLAWAIWFCASLALLLLTFVLNRESRRRATVEMQRLEVFDRITDAFVAVDRLWNYTFVSNNAARLLGRAPKELLGTSMWDDPHNHQQIEFRHACERAMAQQESANVVVHSVDGQRWIDNHIYSNAEGLTVYFRDITQERQQQQQMQMLSRRVLEVQESERRRIAHELHDELGQSLTAIKINLQASLRLPPADQERRSADNIAIIESALQHVRSLSLTLRPSVLDDLGLGAAIEWLAEQAHSRGDLQVELASDLNDRRLAPELETACFRIVQEALTNIQRHSKASKVRIALHAAGSDLVLTIGDNGRGFDTTRRMTGKSLGLLGMEERASLLSGTLSVRSQPGNGCTITLHCPITAQND